MPNNPWNDTTDRQLLLTIIHLTGTALPKWDQVASLMGEGFTSESTRQHFQKMRKECKTKFGAPATAGSAGTSPAKGTPRKRKTADGETPKSKANGLKGSGAGGEDGAGDSPCKKAKVDDDSLEGVFQ
ncbi:hypothetical protein LTR53_013755 [Teratosphaeriaceae sp. CCFEE 6253]|nr:hypothetical protein LTR53_013755 [Teratosphaeriaceae sp. CCFEE 6253]